MNRYDMDVGDWMVCSNGGELVKTLFVVAIDTSGYCEMSDGLHWHFGSMRPARASEVAKAKREAKAELKSEWRERMEDEAASRGYEVTARMVRGFKAGLTPVEACVAGGKGR